MDPNRKTMSDLFRLDDDTELWSPDEYASVFRHQLSAPFSDLLPANDHGGIVRHSSRSRCVNDLLTENRPSTEDLVQLKQFAKSSGSSSQRFLPRPVSAVLYLLAIAKALVSCDVRITEMDDTSLRKKLRWAADQSWVSDAYRATFEETLVRLDDC